MTALPEAPAKSKSWPKRHPVWTTLIVVFGLSGIVNSLGLDESTDPAPAVEAPIEAPAFVEDTDPYAAYGLSETDGLAADLAWDVQSPTEQADLCDGLDTFGSDNPIIVQAFSDAAEVDYATGESILAYIDGEKC